MRRLEANLTANKVSLALEALESLNAFMPTLEQMPNLIDLDLHGNKLTKLPRDLSRLREVEILEFKTQQLSRNSRYFAIFKNAPGAAIFAR